MLIIQLTGLSGTGKSTLALALQHRLQQQRLSAAVIDGDAYRQTLCRDLGFSAADRKENIRRLAREADRFSRGGTIAIMAAINPYEAIRREVEQSFGAKTVWLRCDLDILVQRDPKGLYRKALLPEGHSQKLDHFTGISDPYEPPLAPHLVLDTGHSNVASCTQALWQFAVANLAHQLPNCAKLAI